MQTWPPKDPNEVLDYTVDWATNRLQAGETISTSNFSIVSGDVAINSQPAPANGICKVWLTGGTAGTVSVILNRITTSLGRTYDQSVKLRIRDK